jgi:dihydroflavonol-4-reductase
MTLITGATGFLGSYFLCLYFNENKGIRATKREFSDFKQLEIAYNVLHRENRLNYSFDDLLNKIEWMDVDLLDVIEVEKALEGINRIIHLAAFVSFERKNKKDVLHFNVNATRNLINLGIVKGIKEFHFASSIASLDRNDDNIITEEKDAGQKKFTSAYALSKHLSEAEVWRAYEEGMEGVIINPGVIIGPALLTNEAINIFKFIRKGFPYYPDGQNGYVDVRDVAEIFLKLIADKEYYNERYLIVSESVSYKNLFDMMAESFEMKPPGKRVGKNISFILSYVDFARALITGKRQVITSDLVRLVNSDFKFDNSKIKETLDWEFIEMNKTVDDTCKMIIELENKESGI